MHPNLNKEWFIKDLIGGLKVAFFAFLFFGIVLWRYFDFPIPSFSTSTMTSSAKTLPSKEIRKWGKAFAGRSYVIEIDSERTVALPEISKLDTTPKCDKGALGGFCVYTSSDKGEFVALREVDGVPDGSRWQGLTALNGIAHGNLSQKTVEQADLLKRTHASKYVFRASVKNLRVFQHYFCLVQENRKTPEICP